MKGINNVILMFQINLVGRPKAFTKTSVLLFFSLCIQYVIYIEVGCMREFHRITCKDLEL